MILFHFCLSLISISEIRIVFTRDSHLYVIKWICQELKFHLQPSINLLGKDLWVSLKKLITKLFVIEMYFTWWWASLEALKIWWKDLVLKIRSWKIVQKTLSAILWLVKLCQEPYAHSLLQKQHWCHSFWSNLFMTIRMKRKFQGLTNWCFAMSWYCQQGSISWNKVIQICQRQACKNKITCF